MWLEIDLTNFSVRQSGFSKTGSGIPALYVSAGLERLGGIESLASAEYGQAVEIDSQNRTVAFGRDYLGHHPLLYADVPGWIFISDEFKEVAAWLRRRGESLSVCEESLALYFAMGYVPQGRTVFREIHTCKNATIYRWRKGTICAQNTFRPIVADADFPLSELERHIEREIERLFASGKPVDVWCSGGLDSSIMAACCNAQGRQADILTLAYDRDVDPAFGVGEKRFAEEMAQHCGARMRYVTLDRDVCRESYGHLVGGHIGPVIDMVVPPKYALARATRAIGVTGEGGDPVFSGVKNNKVLFVSDRQPQLPLGWVYALVHGRLAHLIDGFFVNGSELKEFVSSYLGKIIQGFPGSLIRKLFYVNTFEKQGGLIFPKNYYAGKRYDVAVRHPLTALAVYEAGYRMPDNKKYVFPNGKLALTEIYRDRLPEAIINRRKSGTRLPLANFLEYIAPVTQNLDQLRGTGLFDDEKLDGIVNSPAVSWSDHLTKYALLTLDSWLQNNGGTSHDRPVSGKRGSEQQRVAGAPV